MEPDFWHERWRRNEIAFHQAEGNVSLRAAWPALGVAAGARVLVPLCGKSEDMTWLHEQGCSVVGVELSRAAIDAFLAERELAAVADAVDGLHRLRAERYELYVGDFFDLQPRRLGAVDLVVDRAALIALPPAMRARYAEHLLALAGAAPIALVTLEYPPQEMQGPPFSVDEAEVEQHFGGVRTRRLLHTREALGTESGLRARGLTRLTERAWRLDPVA